MAKKIHTKKKRYFGSPSHHRSIRLKSRKRSLRSRTFKTEEAAKAYAEKQGIKKFEIANLRGEFSKEKKLKLVEL
ncbi:MAG: hypothetical protein PHO02_01815 [Candidatus Nanoarchaeia archaeon]|nr:hypothetical protein [Candidatus Nanoarchaeia archaeon]